MSKYYKIGLIVGVFGAILMSGAVFAADKKDTKATPKASVGFEVGKQLNATQQSAGFEAPTDPRILIARLIQVALSFLGIIFVVIIVYAGYLYMTAGGDSDQVDKAVSWIKRSVIGLIIILSAYSITWAALRIALNYEQDPTGTGVYVQPYYK